MTFNEHISCILRKCTCCNYLRASLFWHNHHMRELITVNEIKHSITHHLHQTWDSFLTFVTCCSVLLLVFQVLHPVLLEEQVLLTKKLQTKVRVDIFKQYNFPLQTKLLWIFFLVIMQSDYISQLLLYLSALLSYILMTYN